MNPYDPPEIEPEPEPELSPPVEIDWELVTNFVIVAGAILFLWWAGGH